MSKKMPEGWKMLSIFSNACLGRKVGSLLHSDVIDFSLDLYSRFISCVHFTGATVSSFSLGENLCV